MSGPPSTKNGVALEAMVHLKILATNATFRDKWMPPEAWATALDVKFGVEYSKRVVSIALNGLETNHSFPNPNNANETIVLQEHHFNVTMATNKESKCRFFLFRLSTTNQANELVAAKRKDLWQKAYNDAMKFVQPRRTSKRLRHEEPPPPPPPSSSLQAERQLEMKVAETIQLLSTQSKEHVPPTTLSCALDMARVAWDNFYPPSLAFPLALLLYTATTGPGPSEVTLDDCTDIETLGDSDGFTTSDKTNNLGGRIKTSDIKLSSGHVICGVPNTFIVVARNRLSRLEKGKWIGDAFVDTITCLKCESSKVSQTIIGGFAAAHPTLAPEVFSRAMAISRVALMHEVQSAANIGTPGFLTFHRAARYFHDLQILHRMLSGWKEQELFDGFRTAIEKIVDPGEREAAQKLPEGFLSTCIAQLHKHNSRYIKMARIFRAAFGEARIGQIVACTIVGLPPPQDIPLAYVSPILGKTIDLQKFRVIGNG